MRAAALFLLAFLPGPREAAFGSTGLPQILASSRLYWRALPLRAPWGLPGHGQGGGHLRLRGGRVSCEPRRGPLRALEWNNSRKTSLILLHDRKARSDHARLKRYYGYGD